MRVRWSAHRRLVQTEGGKAGPEPGSAATASRQGFRSRLHVAGSSRGSTLWCNGVGPGFDGTLACPWNAAGHQLGSQPLAVCALDGAFERAEVVGTFPAGVACCVGSFLGVCCVGIPHTGWFKDYAACLRQSSL